MRSEYFANQALSTGPALNVARLMPTASEMARAAKRKGIVARLLSLFV